MIEDILKTLSELGYEIRIPKGNDQDIDKIYINTEETIAYRRIKSIANKDVRNVRWGVAIKYLTNDVNLIANLIKNNSLKHPEEIEEFTKNCCAIMNVWDNKYCEAFNTIKDFRDSYKAPKSIEEMDADELREYIKQHNIK